MEYRKLGNTGLETSVIALGCEAFVEDNSNAMKFLDMAEEITNVCIRYFNKSKAYRNVKYKGYEKGEEDGIHET